MTPADDEERPPATGPEERRRQFERERGLAGDPELDLPLEEAEEDRSEATGDEAGGGGATERG